MHRQMRQVKMGCRVGLEKWKTLTQRGWHIMCTADNLLPNARRKKRRASKKNNDISTHRFVSHARVTIVFYIYILYKLYLHREFAEATLRCLVLCWFLFFCFCFYGCDSGNAVCSVTLLNGSRQRSAQEMSLGDRAMGEKNESHKSLPPRAMWWRSIRVRVGFKIATFNLSLYCVCRAKNVVWFR